MPFKFGGAVSDRHLRGTRAVLDSRLFWGSVTSAGSVRSVDMRIINLGLSAVDSSLSESLATKQATKLATL